jgi:hypothetical protein
MNATQIQLRKAKAIRRQQLEHEWKQRLAAGITIGSITLRCEEADRNAFSQLLVLLGEAERIDQLPAAVPIIDRIGTVHTLSVVDLRATLLGYGSAYQALWLQKVTFHAAIELATTPAAVSAVSITFT